MLATLEGVRSEDSLLFTLTITGRTNRLSGFATRGSIEQGSNLVGMWVLI
jgi:hypothetical protein